MAINQILPFGTGAGANVLTPADYTALGARATGFQSGVAKSKEVNTPLRQSAFVAAMIGQFIVDKAGIDVLDDGDVPGLVADFLLALNAQTQSRIASTAQAQALTDDTVLLTPKKLADAFKGANQSLGATSGWQIFPGGLIRQYGTISGFAGYTITLPVAFPGGIIGRPSATCVGDKTTSAVAAWAETSDLVGNQFKVFTYTVGATGGTINSARAITWEVWGKL
ncbi:hypothetical protein AL520_09325 [Achromobacter xylosoxidans]|nr:hypothetical protein AL520_09325 [Achromobacter xylosoxidans]